jgi:ectoine hydroxylase-related dioxygenase (phytanoyl-CoA dioxygenase family)
MSQSGAAREAASLLATLPPETISKFRQMLLGDVSKLPPQALDMLRSMGIEPPGDAKARHEREIRELGLERNVAELEEQGYTIVRDAFDDDLADRLRERIVELAAEDRAKGVVTMGGSRGPTGRTVFGFLHRGRPFEEAAVNRVLVALMTSVLGHGRTISTFTAMVRPEGTPALTLHSDNQYMPAPFPEWQQVATAVWYLDDVTAEGGASRVVPGSRKLCRHPAPGEGEDRAIALEAPKRSLVMWVGNTWHGNCARTIPGERVTLHAAFCRMHLRPLESFDCVPQEILDRNPPLLAELLGRTLPYGHGEHGPDNMAMLRAHLLTHSL